VSEHLLFAGEGIAPGSRRQVSIPAGRLPSGTELSLSIEVIHGHRPGPTVWLSGAVHGDEIVGVEIIRRVLEQVDARSLAGTLIAIPVVNVFGFVSESRYLPDRRDLNRCFPGSRRGPLASRLARLFVDHVVAASDFGIDFHAGSDDRTNLPQLRGDLDDAETLRLALAFAPPLAVHSKTIRGSLRETALKLGKRILLFEGGEPRRFSPHAVDAGVSGALRTLAALEMTQAPVRHDASAPPAATRQSRKTRWVRAPRGGIFRLGVALGTEVSKGALLGIISSPSGRGGTEVRARVSGMVMGHAVNPLVHQGDGLVHLAELE
jgi:predicted deacylase